MARNGVNGVVGTGGPEPARRGPSGAKRLVETDYSDQRGPGTSRARRARAGRGLVVGADGRARHGAHWRRARDADVMAAVTCAFKSSYGSPTASGPAPTRYAPGASDAEMSPTTARSRRRSLLRTTAPPARFPTAYATRGAASSPTTTKVTVTWPRLLRWPLRRSASNVARSRIRQTTGPPPLSRGEAVATLDPACLEDRPPGTGGHPVSKPVVLGPFPSVGLVSPLHSLVLCARGRMRRGSSAGAPCEQVPAPSAWPPMLGASLGTHQAGRAMGRSQRLAISRRVFRHRASATALVGGDRTPPHQGVSPLLIRVDRH